MQKIFTEQLSTSLNQRLSRIYYLVGQEPLLLNESKDLIVQTALQQGFDEKLEIAIDHNTDWNALFERCQSVGLFFSRQVLILTLPENLTALLHKNLAELMGLLHDDILLILQFEKLAKTNEKQEWFQLANHYEPHLVQINCQAPTFEQYPRWIKQRANMMGLDIEQEAVQLLCYSYENNLLALKQTLQLLTLLYPDNKLTYPRVKEVVEQSSVFTPYQWVDALLEGKEGRAKRILKSLQQEDIQPVILLRILQRELMVLLHIAQPQHKVQLDTPLPSTQLKTHFDQLKVWQNRRPLFTAFLQRYNYEKLYRTFQQLAEIERAIKQDFSADVWDKLQALSIKICLGAL
ncbi:DNA polymerase III subunit delta [Conservatibacter flavescens]|uniref:DNA polymerase III subunit delta n=1 Tax=Conservatibacter flavescens TaxID=28161 RepID=A0A2M8S0A9_9PAST|nr:DNA polymerase III subunit delta [Conservatibacter flavescens]PJG84565.1 DNA polymerase III subunit delta [Conservatibacter flavescens]